jgi:outer membrane receptor protein involved in Fe transport
VTGKNTNKGTAFAVPPGSASINNNSIAGDDINPVTYQGVRGSALWQINDDWNVLVAQTYQDMDSQGVFYQMPRSSDGAALQPLQVSLFNNGYDKDKFENTAWTVNGRVGDIRAVYTGGYLVRHVDQVQDYTNYARGFYADYYQCHGVDGTLAATCYSPSATWREQERNTHQSHELRFSTPDEWRLRGIFGGFWEDYEIQDQTDWSYKTLPPCTASITAGCLTNLGVSPGATVVNPNIRNDNTAFFQDITRGYKQYAFFTSVDFDIIPKVLTITGGTRYYHFTNTERGEKNGSFGCYDAGPGPCLASSVSIDGENERSTYSGFKSRGNITWHITPDMLAYYTFSQGFRPGGFNRTSDCHIKDASGVNQFCIPLQYTPDTLTNNEIGWKTEFLAHRLQWNGALYQEDWKNVQVAFFNPGQTGNLTFSTNGQNFRVRGVETSIVANVYTGLTAQVGAAWNSSKQTNSPYLIANNPALLANPATAGEYGKPITTLANPFGPPGSPTANSPPIEFNVRLRYEWAVYDYNAFVQGAAQHTGHSFTQTGSNPSLSVGGAINTTLLRFENPAYTSYDATAGIGKDAWTVTLFGENLTDKNVSLFTSTAQFVTSQTPLRPRVLGLRFDYKL